MGKMNFANTITEMDLGAMASSVMTDCEKYGMTWGCDTGCPVLRAGKCELKDDENKELYQEYLSENEDQ
jgi:hypothetical protein